MLQLLLPRSPGQGKFKTDDSAQDFRDGRLLGKAFSAGVAERDRFDIARAFVHTLVTAWWHALTAEDSRPAPLRELFEPVSAAQMPDEAQVVAIRLGEQAASLDTNLAAYQIGLAYSGMLPRERRAELGIYYTPPALTTRLIARATEAGVEWDRCRVLDPACGGGAFLAPVAQRILDELPGCNPRVLVENIAARLRGYEIDPFGAWLSQVSLDAVLLPACRAARCAAPMLVTVCDSLERRPPDERFDLVIGNPPYGRV